MSKVRNTNDKSLFDLKIMLHQCMYIMFGYSNDENFIMMASLVIAMIGGSVRDGLHCFQLIRYITQQS